MPRMPWANSSPLIRLMCAVRSRTSRLRSRCERRKSSSSIPGTRTSDQTCRSRPTPGDQRPQQHLDVDSIGFNSAPSPVDLDATWVDHKALDSVRFKEPRQPERVIAYFIAERDHRQCAAHPGPAVAGRSELRHQLFCIAASDWINTRLLLIRKLDRQQPSLLAQFQRAVKSVSRNRRARCPVHLVASFDRKVWTKESKGTIRRAFVRLIASAQEPTFAQATRDVIKVYLALPRYHNLT